MMAARFDQAQQIEREGIAFLAAPSLERSFAIRAKQLTGVQFEAVGCFATEELLQALDDRSLGFPPFLVAHHQRSHYEHRLLIVS